MSWFLVGYFNAIIIYNNNFKDELTKLHNIIWNHGNNKCDH